MTHVLNPPVPLPADAGPAWAALEASVAGCHPDGAAALAHAFAAGVRPDDFAGIWLGRSTDPAPEAAIPVLSFGPKAEEPCRRFCPDGEIGPAPVVGDWSPEDEQASAWIMRFRRAGGRFQWLRTRRPLTPPLPDEEIVWIGMPAEATGELQAMCDGLTLGQRLRVVAIVKPVLRANGGFF